MNLTFLCLFPPKRNSITKTLRAMKLITSLLFIACLHVRAAGYSQQVTLTEKNITPKQLFRKINSQTGYQFFYNEKLFSKGEKITINVKNATIEQVLEKCFKDLPVIYAIIDKTIVIRARPEKPGSIGGKTIVNDIIGIVKDSSGAPLAGATVGIKGKPVRVATDINGRFSITASPGDVLTISYVGYITQEIRVTDAAVISITMLPKPREIEQVVVTALGIKKSARALTYNVQEVKGEEVTRNKDANFVNALAGKIAGVTINPSSSGIGGGSRVVMRGTKSINQNNNVLYVIDGIPMPNLNGGNTKDASNAFGGTTSGEGISSINPEDIESISALTGPSASALYGNQGANGVILVTTKKGSSGKLRINFSHSSDFFSPFVMPKFQNTYGQVTPDQYASWGSKLPEPSGYKPKDFFQTGTNIFNSISFSGGTEKSQTFFSIGTNNAQGIIRKNTYNRYNFYLRHSINLTNRLTVDVNAMYVKQDDRNMIAQGQYHNPLVPIYLFPPGDDIRKYQVYTRYDPSRKISTQFWPYGSLEGLQAENPYWITDAESNINKKDRYMISLTAKYSVFDWLDITGRARIDHVNAVSESKYPAGTNTLFASEYGYYGIRTSPSKNTYADLIATIRHKIAPFLHLTSNVGGSFQDDRSDTLEVKGNLTKLANLFTTNNMVPASKQTYSRSQLQSVFATAQFDYKGWLYLDATGRYEWPSQLPNGFATKSSYFFPSIGISGIINDVLGIPKNILSFAKLRFSYAEVGNPPGFGLTNPVYPIDDNTFRPAPFPEYLPERTRSYEAGAELKFFNNRLSLNATFYKSNTTNQLLTIPLTGSLYTVFYYNAGNIQNKGIEASAGYNMSYSGINWSSNLIFTLNRNKVIRLSEGFKNPVTGEIFGQDSSSVSSVGDLENLLVKGGSMADMYISQVLREDNQGNLWVDPGSGAIAKQIIPKRYIGRTTPDYTLGWRNTLSYNNVELSFLVDARVGGVGVSFTQAVMDAYGVSQRSADDRNRGGVEIYGKLYPNVQAYYNMLGAASGGSVGMPAYYVYSATNVRLREAALAYTIPGKWLGGKVENIRVALTGHNLFMFYNKAPFDPESTASTGTFYQGIDYFRQPSYRSIGFSIRAQF